MTRGGTSGPTGNAQRVVGPFDPAECGRWDPFFCQAATAKGTRCTRLPVVALDERRSPDGGRLALCAQHGKAWLRGRERVKRHEG